MTTLGVGDLVSPSVRLVRELGGGGMGRVWLADHLSLRAPVVVKFLSAENAAQREAVERFAQEAHSASQVRSPHVVQVLDHGVAPSGEPYIVMEHLEGHDLRKSINGHKRLALGDVAIIVTQVAKALSRAHQRGIIHRDIKPENIFLCEHGEGEFFVKLLDFGIAKRTDGVSLMTSTGMVIGTAPYMSPEQLVGTKIDHRSDLWSLGVVAFEALTGELPFKGDTIGALTMRVHDGKPPRPSEVCPDLGAALDAWFARAFAVQPKDRFPSAIDVAESFAALAATFETSDSRLKTVPLAMPSLSDVDPTAGARELATGNPVSRATTSAGSAWGRRRRKTTLVAIAAIAVLLPIVFWIVRPSHPPQSTDTPRSITGVIRSQDSSQPIAPIVVPAMPATEAMPSAAPSTSSAPQPTTTHAKPPPTKPKTPKTPPKTHAPIY